MDYGRFLINNVVEDRSQVYRSLFKKSDYTVTEIDPLVSEPVFGLIDHFGFSQGQLDRLVIMVLRVQLRLALLKVTVLW